MPCRTARVCRPLVQNPAQCLWITDEVLADAFNRFTRALVGAKRHGSNVPGPLEARRRSAKRRMGLASHAASPSPVPDLGSLFGLSGFGTSRRQEFEKSWKYEPPAESRTQEAAASERDGLWKYGWPGGAPRRKEVVWEEFLDVSQHVEVDPVEESRKAFETLLAGKDSTGAISAADMTDVITFLESTSDEPAAHNIDRMMDWIGYRSADEHQLHDFIFGRLQSQTVSNREVAKALAYMAIYQNSRHISEILAHPFGQTKGQRDLREVSRSTTRMLLDHLQPDPLTPAPAPILLWLQCLMEANPRPFYVYTSRTWRDVYRELAHIYTSPAPLGAHLASLSYTDLSRVLLTHWVPHILPSDNEPSKTGTPDATYPFMAVNTFDPPSSLVLREAMERRRRIKVSMRRRPIRQNNPLIDMFIILNQHSVPLAGLAQDVFEIFHHKRPEITFKFFRHFWYRHFLKVDVQFAQRLVHHFLKIDQPLFAYRVFTYVPNLPLSHCYELPLKLAADGIGHSANIWRILRRQAPPDYLETSARNKYNLSLVPEHIELVNLVAWKFALSKTLDDRVAFRRVWECYRFLSDRGAPISTVMTRAVVTAGVVRPLRDRRRPGTTKFKYIHDLVKRVEGEEVARALDRAVYITWNYKTLKTGIEGVRYLVEGKMGRRVNGDQKWLMGTVKLWSRGKKRVRAYDRSYDKSAAAEAAAKRRLKGCVTGTEPKSKLDVSLTTLVPFQPLAPTHDSAADFPSEPSDKHEDDGTTCPPSIAASGIADPVDATGDSEAVQHKEASSSRDDTADSEIKIMICDISPPVQQPTARARSGLGYDGAATQPSMKPVEADH
ncbi:hypothetical protein TI39_contig71g00027 [Zymoseptoria brevis]|uniref:Uncharacterized protein n=1 Tax=Zymoseptoria brevis TaxID=1047168 RepID=A0A0F4H158_9PEZI|nr:hypothetical protein TI39_contig71g00027 [Zymoseptoria brevis]